MNKTKAEKFDNTRRYDWFMVPQSYFQCALIGARILNKKISTFAISEGSPLDYCLKEIYGDYSQSPEYLIFPILFNFKHGIEIYLKCIIGMEKSEFFKNHNLLNLFEKAKIENEEIKSIIEKYTFSRLLLPNNEKPDTENQFERYPQGSPYDDLELFATILDPTLGSSQKNLIPQNYEEIISVSVVSQEKINELIKDIEFMRNNLRKIAISVSQNKQ